jgi:hypothetical protein
MAKNNEGLLFAHIFTTKEMNFQEKYTLWICIPYCPYRETDQNKKKSSVLAILSIYTIMSIYTTV